MNGISREKPTIFDLVFKRLLDLSDMAIIQLINGVFDENYPQDSKIVRLRTEYISEDLRKRLLDVLLAIDGENLCHIEAQIDDDGDMIIRMFEYGYAVALRTKTTANNITQMKFPKARVIYWETTSKTPDKEILRLEFPDGTMHDYTIQSFKLLDYSIEELEQKKLAVLLPFYILKLRKRVKAAKSSEARQTLAEEMRLLLDDLAEAIQRGEQAGSITESDMRDLLQYVGKLVEQVYKQEYDEFKEVDHMLQETILTYAEEAAIAATAAAEVAAAKAAEAAMMEVAKNLFGMGMPIDQISKATGLSTEELRPIAAQ